MLGHLPSLGRGAVCACALALLVAGCGRKGPLEPPPGVPVVNVPPAALEAQQQRVLQETDTPGLIQSPNQVYERSAIAKLNAATAAPPPRPINAPPVAQPSTFLLDPLVK